MATVVGTSGVASNTAINGTTVPAVINLPAPTGLAIGHYYLVVMWTPDLDGTGAWFTPTGFTVLGGTTTTAQRSVKVFGMAVTNSTDLSNCQSVGVRPGGTSARVVAVAVALSGVDMTVTPTIGTVNSATVNTSSINFAAVARDFVINFCHGHHASSIVTETPVGGGTQLIQTRGGNTTKYSGSLTQGGTGLTFSLPYNPVGAFGIGLTNAMSVSGSAAFSGSGTLTASGKPALNGAAAFSGSGTLTVSGQPGLTGSAGFNGSGTLTAAGSPTIAGTAALSSDGVLTASGTPGLTGSAVLTGSGVLTGTGTPQYTGTAALTGAGVLEASGTPTIEGSVELSGSGILTIEGRPTVRGFAGFVGSGELTATGHRAFRDIDLIILSDPTGNTFTVSPEKHPFQIGSPVGNPFTVTKGT